MSLTTEERTEINRQNAAHSTGPVTDDGRARSRQNALKHGLRAEVIPLPHEDPEAIRIRARLWNDHYLPKSPAAQHLVNDCVQATLLSDRIHKYHTAALSEQVTNAITAWEKNREDTLEYYIGQLPRDPQNAYLGLHASSLGCRWLIAQWERLHAVLDTTGYWSADERDEVVRLLGSRSEARYLKDSEHAWTIHLYHIICQPEPSPSAIEELCAAAGAGHAPRGLSRRRSPRPRRVPGRAAVHDRPRDRRRAGAGKLSRPSMRPPCARGPATAFRSSRTRRRLGCSCAIIPRRGRPSTCALNALMKALALDAEAAASSENPPADLVAASSPNEANLKAKQPQYRPRRPHDAKRTLPGEGKANKAAAKPSRVVSDEPVSMTNGVIGEPEALAVADRIATG